MRNFQLALYGTGIVGVALLGYIFYGSVTSTSMSSSLDSSLSEEVKSSILSIRSACLNNTQLTQAQELLKSKKNKIWQDWDVSNYPRFLTLMDIPEASWTLQKHKFISLILRKSRSPKKFVFGFSGSSVTAGHDNLFSEAYPQVVFDSIAPVFNSLSVVPELRNHALGNNPCYPYDACVSTHLVLIKFPDV